MKYSLSFASDELENNDWNVEKTFDHILKTKNLDSFLILAKEHHPNICDLQDYINEVFYFYEDEYAIDSVIEANKYYNPYEKKRYPNLLLIESYLGKKIFVK